MHGQNTFYKDIFQAECKRKEVENGSICGRKSRRRYRRIAEVEMKHCTTTMTSPWNNKKMQEEIKFFLIHVTHSGGRNDQSNIVCAAFCQLRRPTVTQLSGLLVVSQQRFSLSSYDQWYLLPWSEPSIDHIKYMVFGILATLTQIIHEDSCFLNPDCLGTVSCSDSVVLIFPHRRQNIKE